MVFPRKGELRLAGDVHREIRPQKRSQRRKPNPQSAVVRPSIATINVNAFLIIGRFLSHCVGESSLYGDPSFMSPIDSSEALHLGTTLNEDYRELIQTFDANT